MINEITIEDFSKLDIYVGTIIKVSPHPNADKLYILEVDFNNFKRQIVAGIRQHYSEKDLLNKQIVVITNLKPIIIRGVESQGMLLAAGSSDGKVAVLSPDKFDNNSKIR